MDFERLVIAKPSGNITAIVFDDTTPEAMREVGALVQAEYPSVEQVLFVQKHGDTIHGQMAGGEFCGNAARSLGYVLANGTQGCQTFTMSGLSKPVTVEVKADYAKLAMRTTLRHEQKLLGKAPIQIAHLEGISHAIMLSEHPLFHFLKEYAARPDRWNTITHVLDDLGLMGQQACGLTFAETKDTGVHITPYVYVRDIETLYAETACASGSIAAASIFGRSLHIHQPSGESLDVNLKPYGTNVKAEVGGSMAIQWDGPVSDVYGIPPVERGDTSFKGGRPRRMVLARE